MTAAATDSVAQDVWKVAPKNATLLEDTAGVKMILVTWNPGEEMAMHTHPTHMLYVIQGGQLTINHKDGKSMVLDVKDGESMAMPAEGLHSTKNTGKSQVKAVLIEIDK